MKVKLTKQNRKTTDYLLLEIEDVYIKRVEGKEGKGVSFSSTSNCGSVENALRELNDLVEAFKNKGFIVQPDNEEEVFDKASWHFNGDFPKELPIIKGYTHTAYYVGWLVDKGLISEELREGSRISINKFLQRDLSAVEFFESELDGVFTSSDVSVEGLRFTKEYFDFNHGEYLSDYEHALASNLETLYHVEDSWHNYFKISKVINDRYDEFMKRNNF